LNPSQPPFLTSEDAAHTLQTLTVCYHLTQRKINIRKETSTSVNVFSIASFLSMVALLAHLHLHQPDYPPMPLVVYGRRVWDAAAHARTVA